MNDAPITFELLNAYVDGELDPAQAARVALAVADDPGLAREVAALTRLRSAVADSVDAPAMTLPPMTVPSGAEPRGRVMAIAASVALALFIAGTAWMSVLDRDTTDVWLAQVWHAHRGWQPGVEIPLVRPGLLPAGYNDNFPGAYVPDLTASRLILVHLTSRRIAGDAPALLAGYRGTRGCRISLMLFPAQGMLSDARQPFQRGSAEAYGWRVGDLDYVILSDGMDSRRFQLLAESVRKSSRRHAPFDAQTRMALRSSRDSSAPCAA